MTYLLPAVMVVSGFWLLKAPRIYSLCALLVVAPFFPNSFSVSALGFGITVTRFYLGVLAIGFLGDLLTGREHVSWSRIPLLMAIMGYLVVVVLSYLLACAQHRTPIVDPTSFVIKVFGYCFEFYFVYVVAYTLIRKSQDIDRFLVIVALTGGAAGLIGLYESVLGEVWYSNLLQSLLTHFESGSREIATTELRAGLIRVNSSFSHPITFGCYLVLSTLCAAYLFERQKKRSLYLLIALISASGVVLSLSRTPMFMLFISATLYSIALAKKRMYMGSVIIVLFVLMVLPTEARDYVDAYFTLESLTEQMDSNVYSRIDVFTRYLPLYMDHPLLGVGFGTFQRSLTRTEVDYIDNNYFLVLLETGLVGFAFLFLPIVFRVIASNGRARSQSNDVRRQRNILLVLLCSFAMPMATFDMLLHWEFGRLFYVFLAGYLRSEHFSIRK